jgi:hypothetical protein
MQFTCRVNHPAPNPTNKKLDYNDPAMTKETKFAYYTGDCSLGLEPSEGHWDGNKFTSDGVDWYLPSYVEDNELLDGQGIVWLFDHEK